MRIPIFIAASLSIVPTPASAAAFVDEAAWRAAVFDVYGLEIFDALPAGSDVNTLPALGIRFLPLNDGTQPTVQAYANTGGVVKSGPNNLLNDRDFSLPARGPINVVPLNLGDSIFGLGMWNVGGDDQLRLTFYDSSGGIIEQVTSAPSFGFFGIVNSMGAARAEVDFVGGNGYAPTDDWQAAARRVIVPGAVPEPSTWAMMLLGFGFVGGGMRSAKRRQKVTVSYA
ncbi:PEPxxWA-CTERM sorting domain-containing protein [Erythrobacter sp. QSSC1-22B]|uniref:PEPxxWA-CTERM sorting domain-containing protein n=1 Tax=Erythrobacter sp. QSSC1-22B TaxID=1860125 RepID=UPI0009F2872C|nr:PEPxxWA-CTERM sorting domain-containing protein [Erythrobacter sp. QSSC1-22B]